MKRNILTAAVRGTACILSLLLCGSYPAAAGNPADGSGTPAQTEITVNDGEMGTGLFQFEFSAGWVHEGGYPARFVGGRALVDYGNIRRGAAVSHIPLFRHQGVAVWAQGPGGRNGARNH